MPNLAAGGVLGWHNFRPSLRCVDVRAYAKGREHATTRPQMKPGDQGQGGGRCDSAAAAREGRTEMAP
jgi:hypothetical protein